MEIRLSLAGREFSTLGDLADAAIKIEEMFAEKKRKETRYSGRFQAGRGAKGNQGPGNKEGSKRTGSTAGFSSQRPSKTIRSDGGTLGFRCFNCGKEGHLARDCSNPAACYICGKYGHAAADCYQATCYICGKKGHISTKCPNTTARNVITPVPSVAGSTYGPTTGKGRGQGGIQG